MIHQSQFTIAILLMAIITFSVRYAFFMNILKFDLPTIVKDLLMFTAPCVLTALFIPIMFQDMLTEAHSDTQFHLVIRELFNSAYFWASLATIILSLFIRQTLVVIILGMFIFFSLRSFL